MQGTILLLDASSGWIFIIVGLSIVALIKKD